MTRNQERTAPWHKDHTIETVWPYLDLLQKRVTSLVRAVAAGAGGSGGGVASIGSPTRITQQINFSAENPLAGQYLDNDDSADVIVNAVLLYRARGGEIIRNFILSEPTGSLAEWEIEIRQGAYPRSGATSFPDPLVLSVSPGAGIAELRPNQLLEAGQCLFVYVVSVDTETPGRIDGTLEIERDATI